MLTAYLQKTTTGLRHCTGVLSVGARPQPRKTRLVFCRQTDTIPCETLHSMIQCCFWKTPGCHFWHVNSGWANHVQSLCMWHLQNQEVLGCNFIWFLRWWISEVVGCGGHCKELEPSSAKFYWWIRRCEIEHCHATTAPAESANCRGWVELTCCRITPITTDRGHFELAP